jgi:hypothetical protein
MKNPGPSAGVVVAFQNGDLSAQRGKLRGGGNSGKTCANYQGIRIVGGYLVLHGCKTTLICGMFNTNMEIVWISIGSIETLPLQYGNARPNL